MNVMADQGEVPLPVTPVEATPPQIFDTLEPKPGTEAVVAPESTPAGETGEGTTTSTGVDALVKAIHADTGEPPKAENAEDALETIAEHDTHKKYLGYLLETPSDEFADLLDPAPENDERRNAIANAAKFYSEKDDKGNLKHQQLLEADVDEHIKAEDEYKKLTDIEAQVEYVQQRKNKYATNLQNNTEQLVKNKLEADPNNEVLMEVQKELKQLRAEVAAGAYHQSSFEHLAHILNGLGLALQAPAKAMSEGESGTATQGNRSH